MAKDPAFLFYYQDFLVGTTFMSNEEVGIYIRIICHMADKGALTKEHMLSICGAYGFSNTLKDKFDVDSDGLYYNARLMKEVEKRRNYAQSRRNNAKAYAKHMENENEDINVINTNTVVVEKKRNFEKPTIDDVRAYCLERKNSVDPQRWIDHYESNGWRVGKNPMKDWRAAVRTWERSDIQNNTSSKPIKIEKVTPPLYSPKNENIQQ